MTNGGSPLPGTEEAPRGLEAGGPAGSPFWKDRAWWRRAGRTAIAVYLATGLAFVATVVVARGLGPREFGTVVLAVAIATLVATFLDLTLEEAVVHHGYRALARDDTAGIRGLIRASLLIDVAIGLAVASSVVLFAAPLADLASAGRLDPTLVRVAALVPLASTADSTMAAVLQLAGRPDLRGWVMAGTNLVRLGGVVVALEIGTTEAVIVSYAAASAVGGLAQAFIAWRLVRRRWADHASASTLRVPLKELFRFGLHTSISTSLAAAHGALIPVILGRAAGPTAVGVFRVAMFPVLLVDGASGPLRLVLFPEQARLAAEGDVAQLRRSIRTHMLVAIVISIPFVAAAWFALPWLIPLIFSDSFEDAVLPARILLIAAVVHLSVAWFKTLPAAVGKPELRTAVSLIELVLMISLLVVLGDQGSKGAAIAYSAASLVAAVIGLVGVQRVLRRAR